MIRTGRAAARLVRWALLTCVAWAAAAVPAWAGASAVPDWPHLEEVRAILESPHEPNAAVHLERLGPTAAPTLWGAISGQTLTDLDLDRSAARELVRDSFSRWSGPRVVAHLMEALESRTSISERLLLVELLAWTECDDALEAVFEALARADATLLQKRRTAVSLKRALEALLTNPYRFYLLLDLLPELPRELLAPIVEAVAAMERPEATLILARAADMGPAMERAVLTEIGRHGYRLSPGGADDCIRLARQHLQSLDPVQRRLAAVALGKLRDVESFHDLNEHLADDDPVVRRVALQALQQLTGVRRSWTADQWTDWWDAEEARLGDAMRLSRDLTHGNMHRATRAAQELSTHRLFAAQVTEVLADGLRHPKGHVRAVTCTALARLEHPAVVPVLINACGDGDKRVRAAAHAALVSVTGVDLGADVSVWDDWWRSLR